jgi:hypothetical protein
MQHDQVHWLELAALAGLLSQRVLGVGRDSPGTLP